MDEQGKNNGNEQAAPSKKEIQKENSRDVVNTVGKEAGKKALEAYGVPPGLSDVAVNKVAENPLVKKSLNKIADNPLLRKKLSKAKPMVDAAKPLLNAKGGALGGAGGASGASNAGAAKSGMSGSASGKGGSSSLGGGLGKGMGLGSSKSTGDSNGGETEGGKGTADTAKDIADTAMKVKKYWPIISAVAPILGWIALTIMAIILVMIPIMYIKDRIEGIAVGLDKFINFITLNGWDESETVFFKTLQNEYNRFDAFPRRQGEFDIPLIAATVHYSTLITPDSYTYQGDDDKTAYEYSNTDPMIQGNQMRNFYIVANDKLGSAYTLIPGQKKLIGHLIDTKFTTKCVNLPQGWDIINPTAWSDLYETAGEFLENLWLHLTYTVGDTTKSYITKANLLKTIQLIYSYHDQDQNYFTDELDNVAYEVINDNFFADIIRIIKQSNLVNTCSSGQLPIPVINKFVNYEYYKDYLRGGLLGAGGYLSNQPFATCADCEYKTATNERREVLRERWINEIFDQKEAYNYLQGTRTNNQIVEYVPGMSTLPIQVGSGQDWMANVSRGYQLGTAKCFVNGVWNGKTNCNHLGIDFAYPTGTPILAIADGYVLESAYNSGGYGLYVKLGHDIDGDGNYDYYSLYGHMSVISVASNSMVGGGQQIGEVGSTGNSSGPHLHFEIMDKDGKRIDPTPILNGILAGTSELDTSYATKYYNQGDYSDVAYCPGMDATIQSSGCLPSSYAMIISRLYNDKAKDPAYVGNYICTSAKGYRVEGSGTNSAFFTDSSVESNFKINATMISKANATFDKIASLLRDNKPIVVNVRNGDFNTSGQGHFLVLDSIDDNNNVKVLDPGSRNRTKSYSQTDLENKLIAYISSGIWYFERS